MNDYLGITRTVFGATKRAERIAAALEAVENSPIARDVENLRHHLSINGLVIHGFELERLVEAMTTTSSK